MEFHLQVVYASTRTSLLNDANEEFDEIYS